MRFLELSPAEIAFLAAPFPVPEEFGTRLARKLATTLSARLRLAVNFEIQPVAARCNAPQAPTWTPDGALADLWLTRRLGGQCAKGAAPFVPRTLISTLDAALAESWLDAGAQALPAAMAWQITAGITRASLGVQFPHQATDMMRWARGAIRHG